MKNPDAHIKHLEEPITLIQELEKPQTIQLKELNSGEDYKTIWKKTDRGFSISFNVPSDSSLNIFREGLIVDDLKFNTKINKEIYFQSFISRGQPEENYIKTTCELDSFKSQSFIDKKQYYLRYLLPLNNKNFTFHNHIKEDNELYETYKSSTISISSEIISILLQQTTLNIFIYKNENKYIIIDSTDKLNYDTFHQMSFSILIPLGFVTGYAPFDEAYIFAYEDKEMKEIAGFQYSGDLISSMKFSFSPINSNAFAWSHKIGKHKVEEYRNKLKPMALPVFEKLCNETYQNPQLLHALQILLESSSYNTFTKVICQYAVLEKLKFFFVEKLSNKKELKKIKTNEEELKYSFRLLSIPLSSKDEATIEFRNKFLHGEEYNIYNYKNGKYKDWLVDEINQDTFFLSIRLDMLISQLILKYIGYEGYIVNHTKMLENITGVELPEEEYFLFVEEIYQEREEDADLLNDKIDKLFEDL